jgi:hypothetical protein
MFISKAEKDLIQKTLDDCAKAMSTAMIDIKILKAKVEQLERDAVKPVKVKKPKKVMTPAQKAKQREYQRMYKARKKQEENDWKLVQQLATEGTPNVSA